MKKSSLDMKKMSADLQLALIASGVEFDIEHVRPMVKFVAITEEGPDSMLSREEFNNYVAIDSYRAPDNFTPKYGNHVSPIGGFTRVTLKKGEKVIKCKYNFRAHENYCKSTGFVKAVLKDAGKDLADAKIYPL